MKKPTREEARRVVDGALDWPTNGVRGRLTDAILALFEDKQEKKVCGSCGRPYASMPTLPDTCYCSACRGEAKGSACHNRPEDTPQQASWRKVFSEVGKPTPKWEEEFDVEVGRPNETTRDARIKEFIREKLRDFKKEYASSLHDADPSAADKVLKKWGL